jgi:hypothetical protein
LTYLEIMRSEGRGPLRRRLEVLLNAQIIGVAGAQKVYRDAFGAELIAIKADKPSWWNRAKGES